MKEATIDTETGGLDPLKHALLQIGGYDPTTNLRFNVYIRKETNLEVTPGAAKVNGWPQSHDGKPMVDEATAMRMLFDWLDSVKPDRLVAHNAPFDYSFVKAAMSRHGYDPNRLPRMHCTMSQAEQLNRVGGLPVTSLSLNSILKDLVPEYQRPEVHDAAEDAYACWLCRKAMNERFDRLAALANGNVLSGGNAPKQTPRRARWGR